MTPVKQRSPVNHKFQNKSNFALLTVNNVYTDLPPAAVHQRLNKDLSLVFYMLHLRAGIEVADGADLLWAPPRTAFPRSGR